MLVPQTLMIGLLVLAVACFGKFTRAYLGARSGGLTHWEGLAMGSSMVRAMEEISLRPSVSRWGTQPADVLDYRHGSNCNLVDGSTALRWTLSKVEIGEEKPTVCSRKNRRAVALSKTSTVCLCPLGVGPMCSLLLS